MFGEITDVLARPEAYVCVWRDGELYLETVAELAPQSEIAVALAS